MFTGLIEELATVKTIEKNGNTTKLSINAKVVLEDAKIGDSIAVNGICLTVVERTKTLFKVDVSQETMGVTNLKSLRSGSVVNLERALCLSGRLGGHIVSGHIDGVGTVKDIVNDTDTSIIVFSFPKNVSRYIVDKGSICINGISLTVVKVSEEDFTVSIIPHTLKHTNLIKLRVGDEVNLEADMLAKYVERYFETTISEPSNEIENITSKLKNFLDIPRNNFEWN